MAAAACAEFSPRNPHSFRRGFVLRLSRRSDSPLYANPRALRDSAARQLHCGDELAGVARGVPASVEFLGFVEGINRLEDAWAIAAGTHQSTATVTPDAWHMFRGGTDWAVLDAIPADHISCFHWNDAPAEPPRVEQNDSHRVYPGDGILDLKKLANQLRAKDWHGALTLELFNPTYWAQDPLEVARTGLAKMRESVA